MSHVVYMYTVRTCIDITCVGDRTKLNLLTKELSVDCLDTAGHTPLMYAVLGKQAKVHTHTVFCDVENKQLLLSRFSEF